MSTATRAKPSENWSIFNRGDGYREAKDRMRSESHTLVLFQSQIWESLKTLIVTRLPLYSLKCSLSFTDLIRVKFSQALLKKIFELNPDLMLVGVTFNDSANSHLGSNPMHAITDDITADRGTFRPVEFHFQIGPDRSIIKCVAFFLPFFSLQLLGVCFVSSAAKS